MAKQYNLLLVDNHHMFLDGLKLLLDKEPSLKVVAQATNYLDAEKILQSHSIDIVISDLLMPHGNRWQLADLIREHFSAVRLIILSIYNDADTINEIFNRKVNGYLIKNAEKEELLKAISLVASGENYYSAEVKEIFFNNLFSSKAELPKLTTRELEVIQLIAEELTAREIAERLFISQYTVESHRKNICAKLNVKNIAGLIRYACEHNLIKQCG